MGENIAQVSSGSGKYRLIKHEIDQGLLKHNLLLTSTIRAHLESRAEISPQMLVRIIDHNRILSIEGYLDELKRQPEYAIHFPPSPPTIPRRNQGLINANVAKIARGELVVVDD